jgi:putative tricarboxylic transport membrane protein
MMGAALAADWQPERPVEFIVGVVPGTPTDVTLRTMQKIFRDTRAVPTPVSVINKPGAASEIALAYLNQHAGDGHYLFIEPITLVTNNIVGRSAVGLGDITPLAILFSEYSAFSVRKDSPIAGGADLVRMLKKDPASLSIAIGSGLGNSNHLALALVMSSAGVDIKRLKVVVFSGAAAASAALLGGHVDVMISPLSNAVAPYEAGQINVIAVAAPQRMAGSLARVPTWKEQGHNVVFSSWRSLVGPRGMERTHIDFWDRALGGLVRGAEWKKYLEAIYAENEYKASREAGAYLREQREQLRSILVGLDLAK